MGRVVSIEKFRFDDREYETRVTFDDVTRVYTARAYLDGEIANPYSYSVDFDDNFDEPSLLGEITKEARRSVIDRVWEGYVEACCQLREQGL